MSIANSWICCFVAVVACGGNAPSDEPAPGSAFVQPPLQPTPDDMIWLRAGGYRGTELHCPTWQSVSEAAGSRKYEQVIHELTSFAIDRRRTSCIDYDKCVKAHVCPPFNESLPGPTTRSCDDELAFVDRAAAQAYCDWRHLRLPNYYEWQAAVRGPKGYLYPAGNTPPDRCDPAESSTACPFTTSEGVEYAINDPYDEWTRDWECTTIRKRLGLKTAPTSSTGLEVTPVAAVTASINLDIPGFFHPGAKFRCVNDRVPTR